MNQNSAATADQIRRWSNEVARDPTSSAVFDLARWYYGQGRRDAALRLCLRGLESQPEHVEAHVLLGRIYRASGEEEKAFDEWDIALHLDPDHLGARTRIALLCADLERWAEARRHLEHAMAVAPEDPEVRRTVAEIEDRSAPAVDSAQAGERSSSARVEVEEVPATGPEAFGRGEGDGILGAILLDDQGFVVAGQLGGDEALRDEAAAALAGASDDVERAVAHLELGEWEDVVLESSSAVMHLTPVGGAMLAVTGRRDAPIGWIMRVSARLRREAERLLGAGEPIDSETA